MKTLIILLVLLILPSLLYSQENPDAEKPGFTDSVVLYKKIKKLSMKRKWTSWLYGAIFVDPGKSKGEKKSSKKPKDNFNKYKNKIITRIVIITLDPFGANISDTTVVVDNKIIKIGNKLHIKSKKSTIRNQLLFRENQILDPYKLRESERILRTAPFVRDAQITVQELKSENSAVEVTVLVQDQWSISGSFGNKTLDVFDRNFLGLSHEIRNGISYGPKEKFIFKGSYSIPYFRNTFITARAQYNTSSRNGEQGISIGREFYSPITKWAGGINIIQKNAIEYLHLNDTLPLEHRLKYYQQDYWGGISFKFNAGFAENEHAARLVGTGRIFNRNYVKRLTTELSTNPLYQNSTLYLASIGYSFRQYYKDKYIYRFGRNEDVPEGSLFAIIGGIENRENYSRYYLGSKATSGRHFEGLGYLAGAAEFGTFLHKKSYEKGVIKLHFSYFSDLWSIDRWAMRQFIYYRYTNGINRDLNEQIDINGKNLFGLRSEFAVGKNKMTVSFENVLYTPYQLFGFHFATLVFAGFGIVEQEGINMFNGRLFQAYGLGLLLRNENLIINTFQLSFGVYPNLPRGTEFRFNPIGSYQLRFNDFFLSKPDVIKYE